MRAKSVDFKRGIGSKSALDIGFEGKPELEMNYHMDELRKISPDADDVDGWITNSEDHHIYEMDFNYRVDHQLPHRFNIKAWPEGSKLGKYILRHSAKIILNTDDFKKVMETIVMKIKSYHEKIISANQYKLHKLDNLNI